MATKLNGRRNGSAISSIFRYGIFLLISFFWLHAAAGDKFREGISVSGFVRSETGEVIPGVSVVEKGKSNGKFTDEKGGFLLTVSNTESILVFSYMGYVTQEVKVGDKKVFDIRLAANLKDLGEVVITAYGKVKKSSLTDAVFSVSTEKLANRPMRTLSDGLVGLAPGLNIRMPSGAPESSPSINIRGFTSIGTSSSPLILVDGVERPISDVDPNDVEAISLLKDGASTLSTDPGPLMVFS